MNQRLIRVGTTYLPVDNVEVAAQWYEDVLGAELNYRDSDKAIIDLANQSFFLVRAGSDETANFQDVYGNERCALTFEVNGLRELADLHQVLTRKGVKVGEIEDRGHQGRNFVFWDLRGNKFDVWSELSPTFKGKFDL